MARLFSLMSAGAQDDPEYGHFEVSPEHGGFDFPDELSDRLERVCYRGQRAWETQTQRAQRVHETDLARRRDPAELYDAVGEFSAALRQATSQQDSPAAEEIAELKRQLAELRGTVPADGGAEAKPAAGRGRASKT